MKTPCEIVVAKFLPNIRALVAIELDKNYDLISSGKLDIPTAEKMHMDTVWKIIAKKYGWEYGFKSRI